MVIWTKMPATEEVVVSLEDAFRLYLTDQSAFAKRVDDGLKFMHWPSHRDNRVEFLKNGWISREVLHAMVCACKSYSISPIQFIWDKLIYEDVFVDLTSGFENSLITHSINADRLSQLVFASALPNIFRTPGSLPQTYARAILAVDVVKSDQSYRGSGFIFHKNNHNYIVTCKHNVDPNDGIVDINIKNYEETLINFDKFNLHPTLDLAWASLSYPVLGPVFHQSPPSEMFDEVFTMGYPIVPGGLASLVGHRGEVNGYVDFYLGKTEAILISNLVSPGNSGCPVIRRDGLCAGMTIRWAEGEYGGDKARFSCALPISIIASALPA